MSGTERDGSTQRVVVDLLDLTSDVARAVVSAAVQLFTADDPVEVVLATPGDPTDEQAQVALGWCVAAVDGATAHLPEVLLLGAGELTEPALVRVPASADPVAAGRAVALLTGTAQALWAESHPTGGTEPAEGSEPGDDDVVVRALARQQRTELLERVARRDVRSALAIARGERRPTVVGLFQHVSYWPAVEDVYRGLAARSEVDFVPVALDSAADTRSGGTAAFLTAQGLSPRDLAWLVDHLDDVDAVVLENPYDEMRPWLIRVDLLAQRGVRLIGLPYGNNAIGGAFMNDLLWDRPLQRAAWRYYLPSPDQRAAFAEHCRAGDDPVRVLGNPKHDRLVGSVEPAPDGLAAQVRELAGERPVVLWNPHFRTAPGGWSTATRYVRRLLDYARAHDDLVLLVRPHFRLFSELRASGLASFETDLRAATAALPNVLLDESADYRPALGAATAMLSDLSSLASEFLVTGRPLLYLRRADGPGENEHGAYLNAARVADEWSDVESFLDDVRADRDEGRQQRLDAVAATFPFLDGRSAERIVDDVVEGLLDDLGLHPVLRPADPGGQDDQDDQDQPVDVTLDGNARVRVEPAAWQAARRRGLEDAVVLTSFNGRGLGCNPRAIADELERVGHQARRWWVVRRPDDPVPDGCRPLVLGTAEYVETVSRARWVVDNDATAPEQERREGQTVLQTWHGTPLKLLRFDLHEVSPRAQTTLQFLTHQAQQWTHMLSPNPFTTQVLRRGFRFEGTVLESGYPRNDVLAAPEARDARAARTRAALGVRPDQRVVLYAPTWRDDQMLYDGSGAARGIANQPTLDWSGLRSVLGADTALWVRAHRFVLSTSRALLGDGVQDVSQHPDMADLLAAADVLVTDYSSSFFDFALTGRPMVFFAPDLDRYRSGLRGHYFPMEDVVPGPVVSQPHLVTEAIATAASWQHTYADRYRAFAQTYAPWDDGKAAQRVVEDLFT